MTFDSWFDTATGGKKKDVFDSTEFAQGLQFAWNIWCAGLFTITN